MSDTSDIYDSLNDILSGLDERKKAEDHDPQSVPDIIKKDAKDAKPKSTLTAVEKTRAKHFADIYAESFFSAKDKNTKDTADSTVITQSKKPVEQSKKGDGMLSKLPKDGAGWLGTITAIGIALAALAAWVKDNLSPFAAYLMKLPGRLLQFGKAFKVFKKIGDALKVAFNGSKIVTKVVGWFKGLVGGSKIVGMFTKAGGGIIKMLKGAVLKIGGKLMKFLKYVPLLGSIISLGFAYVRFKAGEYVPAVLELISGILGLVSGGLTAPITAALIDGGLLLYDLMKGDKEEEPESIDGSSKKGFFAKARDAIMGDLKPYLRHIPLFGTLYHLGDAYSAFSTGDWKGGLISIGKGIIALIPGGQALMDGVSWLMSLLDNDETETEATVGPAAPAGGLKGIKKGVMDSLKSKIYEFPLFKSIKIIGEAWDKFKAGDWKGGLLSLRDGIINNIPGGQVLQKGVSWIANLIGGIDKDTTVAGVAIEAFDVFGEMWNAVKDAVMGAISAITDWVSEKFKSVVDGAKALAEKVGAPAKAVGEAIYGSDEELDSIAAAAAKPVDLSKRVRKLPLDFDEYSHEEQKIYHRIRKQSGHAAAKAKLEAIRKQQSVPNTIKSKVGVVQVDPIVEDNTGNKVKPHLKLKSKADEVSSAMNNKGDNVIDMTGLQAAINTSNKILTEIAINTLNISKNIGSTNNGTSNNITASAPTNTSNTRGTQNVHSPMSGPRGDGRSDYSSSPYAITVPSI